MPCDPIRCDVSRQEKNQYLFLFEYLISSLTLEHGICVKRKIYTRMIIFVMNANRIKSNRFVCPNCIMCAFKY